MCFPWKGTLTDAGDRDGGGAFFKQKEEEFQKTYIF